MINFLFNPRALGPWAWELDLSLNPCPTLYQLGTQANYFIFLHLIFLLKMEITITQ